MRNHHQDPRPDTQSDRHPTARPGRPTQQRQNQTNKGVETTQDIDKSTDRLITSENLQQDAKHLTALAGSLIARYAALLDTDDHEVSVAAMVALSSLRKIAMRAHDMADAGRSLAQADERERTRAVVHARFIRDIGLDDGE